VRQVLKVTLLWRYLKPLFFLVCGLFLSPLPLLLILFALALLLFLFLSFFAMSCPSLEGTHVLTRVKLFIASFLFVSLNASSVTSRRLPCEF
jgi:hypothetical protein